MSTDPTRETHLRFLAQALDLARLSPPKTTNFRVGCVIVSESSVISTGYTLELPGNTHAEQNALEKVGTDTEKRDVTLYTTLEPCGRRLSGNTPCVERIIDTQASRVRVTKVVFGAREPGTFVKDSKSLQKLDAAGIPWEYVPDLQDQILQVAMEGHTQTTTTSTEEPQESEQKQTQSRPAGTNVDDITPSERARQEALPRNPKKRMMEVDLSR